MTGTAISGEAQSCIKTVVVKQLLSCKAAVTWFCKIALQLELVTEVLTTPLEVAASMKEAHIINSDVILQQAVAYSECTDTTVL